MKALVIGAGGVGSAIANIASRRYAEDRIFIVGHRTVVFA